MKGKLNIGDRVYDCEVVDGERYIDGVPASEFLKRLPFDELMKLAITGGIKMDCDHNNVEVSAKGIYDSLGKKPN